MPAHVWRACRVCSRSSRSAFSWSLFWAVCCERPGLDSLAGGHPRCDGPDDSDHRGFHVRPVVCGEGLLMHAHRWSPTPGGAFECPCGASLRPIPKEVPVTVPTNNEDREATPEQKAWDELARLTSGGGPAANWKWSIPANPDRDSDLILAAGLKALADERDALLAARRLPVSVDNAELLTELRNIRAIWQERRSTSSRTPVQAGDLVAKELSRVIDALSTSQPREVEVSKAKRVPIADPASYCSKCSRYGWHAKDCAAALGGGEW